MPDLAISVRSLGKRYALGERRRGYTTLRDSLAAMFSRKNGHSHANANPARRGGGAAAERLSARPDAGRAQTFWALQNVSFDVLRGEIVGIIGRNGAGKSTLLKILSRITEPTSGEVEISGRTGSLLEVGTGFHPELTGRENIFLNGAILGMKRAEIAARFDEIISFAGTEKFLDTPVKYYSSGMYTRLAFAIAAHLEPEILIVDEVLAVGDAEFQKKCLGKMSDFSRSGRTVLFVSHNMNAVSSLCQRIALLNEGRLVQYSRDITKVLNAYLNSAVKAHTVNLISHANRVSRGPGVFEEIMLADEYGQPSYCMQPGLVTVITIKVRPPAPVRNPKVTIGFTNYRGDRVFAVGTHIGGTTIPAVEGGSAIRVEFRSPSLVPGQYTLDIGFYDENGSPLDEIYGATATEIVNGAFITLGERDSTYIGHVVVPSQWTCCGQNHPSVTPYGALIE